MQTPLENPGSPSSASASYCKWEGWSLGVHAACIHTAFSPFHPLDFCSRPTGWIDPCASTSRGRVLFFVLLTNDSLKVMLHGHPGNTEEMQMPIQEIQGSTTCLGPR